MDSDAVRVRAESWSRRLRAKMHNVGKLAGLALVVLALFNILGPRFTDLEAIAPYRPVFATLLIPPITDALVADLVVLAVGLVVAWWG
jgi:hypothetical protein